MNHNFWLWTHMLGSCFFLCALYINIYENDLNICDHIDHTSPTYIDFPPLLNYNFRCFRACSFQFFQPSILMLSNKIFSKNTRKLGKPWRSKPLTLTVFLFVGCTVQGSWNKNQPILNNGAFMFGKSLKISIYIYIFAMFDPPKKASWWLNQPT